MGWLIVFFCSVLKMKAQGFSKTLISIYQIARRHIPEDRNFYTHRSENVFSHLCFTESSQNSKDEWTLCLWCMQTCSR
jgi:hypothetical protein